MTRLFFWRGVAAAIFTLCLLFALSATSFAAESLLRISSDPYTNPDSQHKTQVEPDTFSFGTTVVSAFQSGRFFDGGASNIGWATSTDGGVTWTHGFLPATTVNATPPGPYARASDPSVAYDARHKVWIISFLGLFPGGNTSVVDVLVSRSTDGGHTWGDPVVVSAKGQFYDKNWSVCDDWASSPFFGHCYTEFDNFSNINRVQMSTSTDGGQTWGAPKTSADKACVIGGQPLVQPGGTVIVPIDDCFEGTLLSFRSTDGGATWSRTVLAAQLLYTGGPSSTGLRVPDLPSAEIDASGKVYVVWYDCRFEAPNCAFNDIVMTTSTDGIHWTFVQRIPIDPLGSGVEHFIPGLAVDRTTSGNSAHLALAYYYYPTSACTPDTCQLNVGFITSTNGGKSWSNKEHLAGPMKLTWLANTTQGRMVGDYISTSIEPGDDDAAPVFTVAFPPTGGTSCDVPPVVCHEATYTVPESVGAIVGGTNVAASGPTYRPSQLPAKLRYTDN